MAHRQCSGQARPHSPRNPLELERASRFHTLLTQGACFKSPGFRRQGACPQPLVPNLGYDSKFNSRASTPTKFQTATLATLFQPVQRWTEENSGLTLARPGPSKSNRKPRHRPHIGQRAHDVFQRGLLMRRKILLVRRICDQKF